MVAGNRGQRNAFTIMKAASVGRSLGGRPPKRKQQTASLGAPEEENEVVIYRTPSRPKRGRYLNFQDAKNHANLQEAIEACTGTGRYAQTGKMPVSEAARTFDVKRSTLHGHLKKVQVPKRVYVAPEVEVQRSSRLLNRDQSETLARQARAAAQKGHPFDYDELRVQARLLYKRYHKTKHLDENKFSHKWATKFAADHGLSVRKTQPFAQNRASAVSRSNAYRFFAVLEDGRQLAREINARLSTEQLRMEDPDAPEVEPSNPCCETRPSDEGNMDETSLVMDAGRRTGLFPVGTKDTHILAGKDKTMSTQIACVCADGTVIDSMYLIKAGRQENECRQRLTKETGLPGDCIQFSAKGWTSNEMFMVWARHFVSRLNARDAGCRRAFVLILDGHGSHERNYEASRFLLENHVVLVKMPSHTSSVFQPLDISVFKPLKEEIRKSISKELFRSREQALEKPYEDRARHPKKSRELDRWLAPVIAELSFRKVASSATIKSGFRKAGIRPVVTAEEWINENRQIFRLESDGAQVSLHETWRKEAMKSARDTRVCVVDAVTITMKHIKALYSIGSDGELDDAIIRAGLLLFARAASQTVFLVDSVAVATLGWDAYGSKFRTEIDQASLVLVPVHEPTRHHWWMAAYHNGSDSLMVMDSLPRENETPPSLAGVLRLVGLGEECYTVVEMGRQTNSYDCGAFTVLCGFVLIQGEEINSSSVNQSEIEWIRKQLIQKFYLAGRGQGGNADDSDAQDVVRIPNVVNNINYNYSHCNIISSERNGIRPILPSHIESLCDSNPPRPRKNLVGEAAGAPCVVNNPNRLDALEVAESQKLEEEQKESAKRTQRLADEAAARQVLTLAGVSTTTKITVKVLREFLKHRGIPHKSYASRAELLHLVGSATSNEGKVSTEDNIKLSVPCSEVPKEEECKPLEVEAENVSNVPLHEKAREGDKEAIQSLLPLVRRKMGLPIGSKVTVMQMKGYLGDTKSGGSKLDVMRRVLVHNQTDSGRG